MRWFGFYTIMTTAVAIKHRPFSHMQRHFATILNLVKNLVVRSIGADLMVFLSISPHDLLNIPLLLGCLLLFHRNIILFGDGAIVKHSFRNFLLHFD